VGFESSQWQSMIRQRRPLSQAPNRRAKPKNYNANFCEEYSSEYGCERNQRNRQT